MALHEDAYRWSVLLLTLVTIGTALTVDPPAAVATALAEISATPRSDGLHVQVATNGDVADDNLFLHPGMNLPCTLKVTFEAALTLAVIVTALR
jgi:hypothetical protein